MTEERQERPLVIGRLWCGTIYRATNTEKDTRMFNTYRLLMYAERSKYERVEDAARLGHLIVRLIRVLGELLAGRGANLTARIFFRIVDILIIGCR